MTSQDLINLANQAKFAEIFAYLDMYFDKQPNHQYNLIKQNISHELNQGKAPNHNHLQGLETFLNSKETKQALEQIANSEQVSFKNENGTPTIYIKGISYAPEQTPAYLHKINLYEQQIQEYILQLADLRKDKAELREKIAEQKQQASLIQKDLVKVIAEKEDFEKKYAETIKQISQLQSQTTTNDQVYQQALSLFLQMELKAALALLETVNHNDVLQQTAQRHIELGQQAMLKVEIYRLGGNDNIEEETCQEAIKHFLIVLVADPKNVVACFSLANIYYELLRYEEAKKYYIRAIEIKPDYYEVWNNLGILYQNAWKEYGNAKNAYLKAIEIKPDFHVAWCNLGILYQDALQDNNNAKNAYLKVIEIKPDHYYAWGALGFLYQSIWKEYENAKNAYLKALEIKPDYHKIWDNLGVLYLVAEKNYSKAKECFSKAIALQQTNSHPLFNMACAYSLEQNKTETLAYLQQAITLNPEWKIKAQQEKDFAWLWADADFLAVVGE